jgi:crotonobetainyl-CoA:carnitine CoA-transferase CaiB-like acyl-CoA transferase
VSGPLSGLRVLDLTHYVAGPYCTKLLADYGAAVIKIERPGEGDPTRRLGPFPDDAPHPEKSGLFMYLNTNKQSVTVDVTTSAGREIVQRLAARVDVLVESFEPRVMPSLGLSYEALCAANPRLVMTSISNFGQTGPYRDWRAEEITEYALSGLMHITGEPDQEPLKAGGRQCQFVAGLTGALATMTGVTARRVTDRGQHIDLSILETGISQMGETFTLYTHAGKVAGRSGNRQATRHPVAFFACRDGYVALIASREDNYAALVEMTGLERLSDPRFATATLRRQRADEFDAILAGYLMLHTKAEILREAQARKLPVGMVLTPGELLKDPHYAARGYFADVEHPVAGTYRYPGSSTKWSATPCQPSRAPLLGEHTASVLKSGLGFTDTEVVRLTQQHVI